MDFKQASGIPRPVDDLPAGTISIRVIRGDLSNPIVNHPVELRVGDDARTQNTDAEGRAEFIVATTGTVRASTVVDGERLESQPFPAPGAGAVRMLLVATDKEAAARAAEEARNAVTAPVVLGKESELVLQPGDESVTVYYLLEIVNPAQTVVNPPQPFTFDVPRGAQGAAIIEGPEGKATVKGRTVLVQGPFRPGQDHRAGGLRAARDYRIGGSRAAVPGRPRAPRRDRQEVRRREADVTEHLAAAGNAGRRPDLHRRRRRRGHPCRPADHAERQRPAAPQSRSRATSRCRLPRLIVLIGIVALRRPVEGRRTGPPSASG